MDAIWAPWRRGYVLKKQPPSGCLFCRAIRSPASQDAQNFVLFRSRHSFVILNRFPYNNGHLMVVPRRHVVSLGELKPAEQLDLLRLLDRSLALLKRGFKTKDFNVGMNLGRIAGAGVPNHIHVHVVPRWLGDTNFMPVLTGSKVISDSLEGTYAHLRALLESRQQK